MAISAYILKLVEKDPFLRLQMRAKEMFNQRNYGFLITKELNFGFQILDLKDHFSAYLITFLSELTCVSNKTRYLVKHFDANLLHSLPDTEDKAAKGHGKSYIIVRPLLVRHL